MLTLDPQYPIVNPQYLSTMAMLIMVPSLTAISNPCMYTLHREVSIYYCMYILHRKVSICYCMYILHRKVSMYYCMYIRHRKVSMSSGIY